MDRFRTILSIRVLSMFSSDPKHEIVRHRPDTIYINQLMEKAHIPGLSIQVVSGEQTLYSYQSGYATLDSQGKGNIPITRDSIFNWCSITKTVCAMAVMQQVEIGLVDLDTDINKYIVPNHFSPICNRYHPKDAITLRHLLTHTASIGSTGVLNYFQVPQDDFTGISLEDFLENYLRTNGKYYVEENWLNCSIGSKYSYSNVGIGLAAWIIELVTKTNYMTYTKERIFQPLGLHDVSWTIKDYTEEQQKSIVHPYMFNVKVDQIQPYLPQIPITQLSNKWIALELNSIQPYPAGQLRSTIESLSVLLSVFINNGTYKGIQILHPKSVQEISTVQYPDLANGSIGLVYTYFKSLGFPFDKNYLGHNGSLSGYATWMLFDPETNIGVCLLSNGDLGNTNQHQRELVDRTLISIVNYLFQVFEQ